MDSTLEDLRTSSEISLEEDIVDQLCTVDLNDEIPARPSSRLGFNCDGDDDPPLMARRPPEGVHHKSSYETEMLSKSTRLDDDEYDITTLMPQRDIATKIPTRSHQVEGQRLDHDVQFTSENEYSDLDSESDHSSSDEEDHASPLDELVRSFSHPPEESDWSLTPKFSCLPSPLSSRYIPLSASSFRHTPQRHRYRHHGHSRHALLHLKWFWASREDSWLEHKARIFEAKAYDGFSIFNSVSPGLRLSGGCIPPDLADTPQPPPLPLMTRLPPLSIHPRRGDLSALHDPYCMHIDRYFVGMPLWTMSKTLWMFDVHMASGDLKNAQQDVGEDLFEDRSEGGSIETSDSNAFSDDSDSTLVESDNEADHSRRAGDVNKEMNAKSKGYQTLEREILDASSSNIPITGDLKTFMSPQPAPTNTKYPCSPPWATSWYRRWEVLLQLCVERNPNTGHSDVPLITSSTKSRRFFIGDDWDDDISEDETAEDDDEEEEEEVPKKNVLVVVNDECSSGQLLRHWL